MSPPTPIRTPGESAFMEGGVGRIMTPDRFPLENIIITPGLYSYEGNWLFCTFDQEEILAGRLGFGWGRFAVRDYGLEEPPGTGPEISCRLELITPDGLWACVLSMSPQEAAIELDSEHLKVTCRKDDRILFRLHGWPQMNWSFANPDHTMTAKLTASFENMVVWPDKILPNHTFSMCAGTCKVGGAISIPGRTVQVNGVGFFDHPRVLTESNSVPSFGWYLFTPLRFADGTRFVGYYAENGLGKKDESGSVGFLSRPDGRREWLNHCRIHNLLLDDDGQPLSWEADLRGQETVITYRATIAELPIVHRWGFDESMTPSHKYVAFPLLMEAEGECKIGIVTTPLKGGSGIAEFLARKGSRPGSP